jgi:predicted dehydrogenase
VLAAGAPDWVFERQSEAPFVPASPFPLTHLIDCLENNRQVAATIQEARRSLVVAMAAYESARQSRPIHLSW